MSGSKHPPFEDIADLSEGLLSGDRASAVQAHLDDCPECDSVVEALGNVSLLLADVRSSRDSMPESVASRLDDALAQALAERAAGVVSLSDRRTTSSSEALPRTSPSAGIAKGGSSRSGASSGARPRRSWLLLGGAAAAAALVVSVGIGQLSLDGFGSGMDASSSEDNAAGQAADGISAPGQRSAPEDASGGFDPDTEPTNEDIAPPGAAPSPGPGTSESEASPRLTPDNLGSYASRLDKAAADHGAVQPLPDVTAGYADRCATLSRLRAQADGSQTLTAARWRGKRALVLLNSTASRVFVYDCEAPPNLLYRTGY